MPKGKGYPCKYCGFVFDSNTSLIGHINTFHQGARRTERRKAMSSWGFE